MKIRKSFVTNSSSSSFVVGFKSEGLEEIEKTMETVPAIFKSSYLMVKSLFNFDSAIVTKDDLNQHFMEQYGWRDSTVEDILADDDWFQKKYDEMSEYINNGYGILDICVDYNDETLSEVLSSLPKKDSEIILISHDY